VVLDLTPLQNQDPSGAYAVLESDKGWDTRTLFGVDCTAHFTGMVARSYGDSDPVPPTYFTGTGFDYVTFRDIKSGKEEKILKFTAHVVKAGDVPGLLPK
jgi:hypothetical protein